MKLSATIGVSILAASLLIASCQSSSTEKKAEVNENYDLKNMEKTSILFDTIAHNFDTLKQGVKAKHSFMFTNTGEHDLVLGKVRASCGCTVPEWTKDPIAPGDTGQVSVQFNTMGRKGIQQKSITVVANTEPRVSVLHFTAVVVE